MGKIGNKFLFFTCPSRKVPEAAEASGIKRFTNPRFALQPELTTLRSTFANAHYGSYLLLVLEIITIQLKLINFDTVSSHFKFQLRLAYTTKVLTLSRLIGYQVARCRNHSRGHQPKPPAHRRKKRGGQLKTWMTTLKKDLVCVSGPDVFGLRRRSQD